MKYKLPTERQSKLYVKLRKKGFSVNLAGDLMKRPGLARKVLSIRKK